MLRKKTKGVAIGSQTSSFIGKASEKIVDRRAFLKGSGLAVGGLATACLLYTSPSPRDRQKSRMPSSA